MHASSSSGMGSSFSIILADILKTLGCIYLFLVFLTYISCSLSATGTKKPPDQARSAELGRVNVNVLEHDVPLSMPFRYVLTFF